MCNVITLVSLVTILSTRHSTRAIKSKHDVFILLQLVLKLHIINDHKQRPFNGL